MFDLFEEITSTLKQNKMRTALTGFAVTWGILIIIVLLGTSKGLMNAIAGNFVQEIKHLMTIYPGTTSKPYNGVREGTTVRFSDKDVDYILEYSDKIDKVRGSIDFSDNVSFGSESLGSNSIVCCYPMTKEMEFIPMKVGRFINDLDILDLRKCVVIDDEMAETFLDGKDCAGMVGKNINIGKIPFKVVGICEKNRNNWGSTCYIPYSTGKRIRTDGAWMGSVTLEFHGMETEEENTEFMEDFRRAFNTKRGFDPEDGRTIFIYNMFLDQKSSVKAMGVMEIAMWILGLLTLLSGIVGVSNIMLITVKERTKEFGIRKALGAKPRSILSLVVLESIAITALFGFFGVVLGMLANWYLDASLSSNPVDVGLSQMYMFKDIGVGLDTALKATLLLVVCGTVAGIIPAWKGARVRPIEALRAEK